MALREKLHEQPPNLRRGTARERCGLCRHFGGDDGERMGQCMLYGARVKATEVCDSFAPKNERSGLAGAIRKE